MNALPPVQLVGSVTHYREQTRNGKVIPAFYVVAVYYSIAQADLFPDAFREWEVEAPTEAEGIRLALESFDRDHPDVVRRAGLQVLARFEGVP